MDLAATSLDAYVLFSAPRDQDAPERPDLGGGPPPRTPPRGQLIGWLAGAFYGLLIGVFMLGVTAGGEPLNVARYSLAGLTAFVAAQSILLRPTRRSISGARLAQALTAPALALAITGLGALARLSV